MTKFLKRPLHISLLLIGLVLLLISPLVLAQAGDFTLSWWTVDGGGGHSIGGGWCPESGRWQAAGMDIVSDYGPWTTD